MNPSLSAPRRSAPRRLPAAFPAAFRRGALLAAVLLAAGGAQAQQICTGNATLTSQAIVNTFQCSYVPGDLIIRGNTIVDLSPLSILIEVGGALTIENNGSLTSLDGLGALTAVGGPTLIRNNAVLTSLGGLGALRTVDGPIDVLENPALATLGLVSLEESAQFRVRGNPSLTSLGTLPVTAPVITILNNDALPSLAGLTGTFANLNVIENDTLTSVALSGATFPPGGALLVTDNAALTSLDGLPVPNALSLLSIHSNPRLTDLSALSGLTSVSSTVSVARNTSLAGFDGFGSLTTVGGTFYVQENTALSSTAGLAALESIGGGLQFYRNPALPDLDGLSNLASVGGALSIMENAALTSIEGLAGLEAVGGSLFILDNPALPSLRGLEGVSSVGFAFVVEDFGFLTVRNNASLTDLDGLAGLDRVLGRLMVSQNPALVHVDALAGLSEAGSLTVTNNAALGRCSCGLYPVLSAGGVEGAVSIENNAPGCNAPADIVAGACGVPVEGGAEAGRFSLAAPVPNPVRGVASLGLTVPAAGPVTVAVYDALGRRVFVLHDGPLAAGTHTLTLDGARLPAGAYVVRAVTAAAVVSHRVTVVR